MAIPLGSLVGLDGKMWIFTRTDGWLRRYAIDAREIQASGEGVFIPSAAQYVEFARAHGNVAPTWPRPQYEQGAGGAQLLVAPAPDMPEWLGQLVADLAAPAAAPSADPIAGT